MKAFDVAIIGAGAAGLMCAAVAGQRGRSVVLIDHATRLAEKIRISGGGRCNFTNREVGVAHFVSDNPDFALSVLARYGSRDFIALVERHRIAYHEKHRGQLFCDDSSERIIAMLVAECEQGRVAWRRPVAVRDVTRDEASNAFVVVLDGEALRASRVVVATGGLSIPKIGASDFAYRYARRFGLRVVEPRPALVPFTMEAAAWQPFAALSGLSLDVSIAVAKAADDRASKRTRASFREDLLLTHRGVSGPAALQISNYWRPGDTLAVDLTPDIDAAERLVQAKATSRQSLVNVLERLVPARFAERCCDVMNVPQHRRIADLPDATLRTIAAALSRWTLRPTGTEGFRKAEVTTGGVDTRDLSQASLEARGVPGLHFIGEAVDMTGWLGGYNFQWAWSSAFVCGQAV